MKKYFLLALIISLFCSCGTNSKPVASLLGPDNIKSQIFVIDAAKDTQLVTSHGTFLRLTKGTFSSSTQPVTIEIKEVFTPAEIFLSGLATRSGSKLLRSAGMIFFNATSEGKPIKPQLPVLLSIPTKSVDPDMKVFKGETIADSSINWIDPQDISFDTTKKKDYPANTVALADSTTGPRTNNTFAKDTTAPARNIDCGNDTLFTSVRDSFPEYDTSFLQPPLIDTTYERFFRDVRQEQYEFTITDNGWYNVDAFLKTGEDGIKEVRVTADLQFDEDAVPMNLYLFVPSKRIMQSTFNKKGNKYYFDFDNGTVPLPYGSRAVLFAYGSTKNSIVYGISEFTITDDQLVPVVIKETTKEKLQYILQGKNIDGVQLDAIEKKMEVIPKPCLG
ncbi:MAG TPA: hypothetical protein VK666_28535, partial [Chryseolinea sp.]|nr:hypothetical protein [Chryseolinea sp.]